MHPIVPVILIGMGVMLAGTIPRNVLFAANLRYYNQIPWAVPLTVLYLWCFWQYLRGQGPPASTAAARRAGLRANRVCGLAWAWALCSGVLGLITVVLGLRVLARLVELPQQQVPDLSAVPDATVLSLILMGAVVAGVVEEASFRGYMQGALEQRYRLTFAIVITGTMFALAHLEFTPILWPYYVAVAAVYGTVTHLTGSILPAGVLHTAGNIYSNLALWRYGLAEWQAQPGPAALVWETGLDGAFGWTAASCVLMGMATTIALARLRGTTRPAPPPWERAADSGPQPDFSLARADARDLGDARD